MTSRTTIMLQHSMLMMVLLLAVFSAAFAAGGETVKPVRLAVVNTSAYTGLMADLLADFKQQTGLDVELSSGQDLYERAREGEVDILISHYGLGEVQHFVQEGYGRWPRPVFANQQAIIGPRSDPAKIRGMTSATEAFRRIAEAKAPFVPNNLPSVAYLTAYLWESAGRPDKAGWYLLPGEAKGRAIQLAGEKSAYVIWGAAPFLRFAEKHGSHLEILVAADPVLQRVMASVIVNPEKVPGVNAQGAEKLEEYLRSPRAQARVAAFRSPGAPKDLQLWWPAAHHNDSFPE